MRTLALLVVVALPGAHASAWSLAAHHEVANKAIDALPGPLKGFYKKHRLEMPSLSPDARGTEHSLDRRFAIDRVAPFPFRNLPRTEADFVARFGEDGKNVGRLPWLIRESYDKLVEAFKTGEKDKILKESDTLAAFLADLHNPLALTDNADGQKTDQPGLWMRFTERFPGRASNLGLDADAAHLIDDPTAQVFAVVTGSYVWIDNILYADDLARRYDTAYTGVYYEALDERAGKILRERLGWASRNISSFWYTAWTVAGKPELR